MIIIISIMSHIVKTLDSEILHCIENAKSISVAAALTNSYGVDLLSSASKTCLVRVVAGVNLPTSVDVLNSLRNKYNNNPGNTTHYPEYFILGLMMKFLRRIHVDISVSRSNLGNYRLFT